MYRLIALLLILPLLPTVGALADPIHDAASDGDVTAVDRLLDENPALISAPDTALSLPIHLAAVRGQSEVVVLLLDRGADIEAGDRESTTPLTAAAMLNQADIVRLLVDRGASLTARDENGVTPFLAAVRCGNLETVRFLVERGAPVSDVNSRGFNALHIAASVGALDIVRYLSDFRFDYNALSGGGYAPLHFAAMSGNPDLVRLLASKGATLDLPDGTGITPLLHAVYAGRFTAVQALVELGADINYVRPGRHGEDQSILTAAIWRRIPEITNYLLAHGADPARTNQSGETALHMAAAAGDTALARVLVERGLDVNQPGENGLVPLSMAGWGEPVMMQWLVDHGARVEGTSGDAGRPLNYAANSGNVEGVRILLTHGADPNADCGNWSPPLLSAVTNGHLEIARLLLEAGADPNKPGVAAGQRPLHFAARNGKAELTALLLDHGAEVDPTDSLGRTPLFYAERYVHTSTAAALKARGARVVTDAVPKSPAPPLDQQIPAGQADIRYLGHSGWAVRTQNHFLVFDYWQSSVVPDEPGLANGYVVPSELPALPVTVFSSHEHADHYDTLIFDWQGRLSNLTYVFGHRPRGHRGYEYVGPGETKEINGLRVSAIRATDAGVGFIVEVDGLTIFHAGDHAAGQVELPAEFTTEIDYIAERWPNVDLAFIPILGCSLGTPESVRAGDFYVMNRLHPKVVFPQHAMNAELGYFDFRRQAESAGFTEQIECAEHRGDRFYFGGSTGL